MPVLQKQNQPESMALRHPEAKSLSHPPQREHVRLLDKLQTQARGGENWTLAHDAELTTVLRQFSLHARRRAGEVSEAIVRLDEKSARVKCEVLATNVDLLLRGDSQFLENRVEAVGDGGVGAVGQPIPTENSSAAVDEGDAEAAESEMEAEENAAIREGMKALSIFCDPAKSADDRFGEGFEGSDNADSCWYYESSPDDLFNQRPLPFLVASREFAESCDAGLGEEDTEGSLALQDEPGAFVFPPCADRVYSKKDIVTESVGCGKEEVSVGRESDTDTYENIPSPDNRYVGSTKVKVASDGDA